MRISVFGKEVFCLDEITEIYNRQRRSRTTTTAVSRALRRHHSGATRRVVTRSGRKKLCSLVNHDRWEHGARYAASTPISFNASPRFSADKPLYIASSFSSSSDNCDAAGSCPMKSVGFSPKTSQSFIRLFPRGADRIPASHSPTADCEIPKRSAKSCWLKPRSLRRLRTRSAKRLFVFIIKALSAKCRINVCPYPARS